MQSKLKKNKILFFSTVFLLSLFSFFLSSSASFASETRVCDEKNVGRTVCGKDLPSSIQVKAAYTGLMVSPGEKSIYTCQDTDKGYIWVREVNVKQLRDRNSCVMRGCTTDPQYGAGCNCGNTIGWSGDKHGVWKCSNDGNKSSQCLHGVWNAKRDCEHGCDSSTGHCIYDIPGIDEVWNIVENFLDIFPQFIGVVAAAMFVYGSYMWIFSAGEPQNIKKAQGVLTWAVIGLIFYIISRLVFNYAFELLEIGRLVDVGI